MFFHAVVLSSVFFFDVTAVALLTIVPYIFHDQPILMLTGGVR